MLNCREKLIFETIKDRKFTTISDLENALNLSKRSVRYAMKTLREKLSVYDIDINYNSNKGYYLSEFDDNIYRYLIADKSSKIIYPQTKYERFMYILGVFLIKEKLNKEEISASIYRSSSTINNDIKSMLAILKNDFDYTLDKQLTFKKKIQIFQIISQKENYLVDDSENKNLIFFFGKEYNSSAFNSILNDVQALDREASNYKVLQTAWILYFINILKANINSNLTNTKGKYGIVNEYVLNVLPNQVELTAEEVLIVDKVLIAAGWLEITNLQFLKIKKLTNKYLHQLIELLELEINLDAPEITNFISHLVALKQRINDDSAITAQESEDIRLKFPFAYYLSNEFLLKLFNTDFNKLTSHEIAMVTIYLETLLFSTPRKLKTLLVCGSGFGITTMLHKWVDKYFYNRLEIIDYCSIVALDQYIANNDVDLVLSTLSLAPDLKCKNIQINKLPTVLDIEKVEELINSYNLNINYLNKILTNESINIFTSQISFEDVIYKCCKNLKVQGIIESTDLFVANLLEREAVHSTYFGNGIIVPHPTNMYSKENRICINLLNEPIKVYGNVVNIIIILALNDKIQKNISSIYELILYLVRNEDVRLKLSSATTEYEVIIYLSKIINNI